MPRDSQRSKAYLWERTCGLDWCNPIWPKFSLDDCAKIIAMVWQHQKMNHHPLPRLEDGRGRRRACGGPSRIALPRLHRTLPTVLHETAHAILGGDQDGGWHGPKWVSLYIDLLERFAARDAADLRSVADRLKLKR